MANQKQQPIGPSQDVIPFSEIHEGIIITKTGELRAILMVTSINFSLKSDQEQNAIIFSYQNFLNSLSFNIQILMQSKRLDLTNYLAKLQKIADQQSNELLRAQTIDYISFIKDLIKIANIMDKKFFVVIPYAPIGKIQPVGGLFNKKGNSSIRMTQSEFDMYKKELAQRVQIVQSGLSSIGLRSAVLNSQQVVELFYGIYNPEEAAKQKLINYDSLNSQIIETQR